MENANNKDLNKMMQLAEEVNSINQKVNQLVQDLHGSTGVLINLQELTETLKTKVGSLTTTVNGYKPTPITDNVSEQKSSGELAGIEPHRIVPTPETIGKYQQGIDDSTIDRVANITAPPVKPPAPKNIIREDNNTPGAPTEPPHSSRQDKQPNRRPPMNRGVKVNKPPFIPKNPVKQNTNNTNEQ